MIDLSKAKIGDKFRSRSGRVFQLKQILAPTVAFTPEHIYQLIKVDGNGFSPTVTKTGRWAVLPGETSYDMVEKIEENTVKTLPTLLPFNPDYKLQGGERFTWGGGEYIVARINGKETRAFNLKNGFRFSERNLQKYADIGYTLTKFVTRDGQEMDLTPPTPKLPPPPTPKLPPFEPVGTWIEFTRDSKSKRFKKGDVGRVVGHGPKSLVVVIDAAPKAIFVPPGHECFKVRSGTSGRDLRRGDRFAFATKETQFHGCDSNLVYTVVGGYSDSVLFSFPTGDALLSIYKPTFYEAPVVKF